jgi:predicted RNase H-like HicB family nuclease
MSRKFKVIIEKKGNEYVGTCPEIPDVLARGKTLEEVLVNIKAVITKNLEGGSDAGSAPAPKPSPRPPTGPTSSLNAKLND